MLRMLYGSIVGAAAGSMLLFWPLSLPEPQGPPYQELSKVSYDKHPNQHFLTKVPKTVCIIGGGASGLITAKVLKQQAYDVQVLEKRDHIGGVWYDNYEGAGLQEPFCYYNMPDFTFPPDTPLLPKQDIVLEFFNKYVQEFDLKDNIRVGVEVTSIRQLPNDSWEVSLSDGSQKTSDFLVLCNGTFHSPNIPSFSKSEVFQGKIIHSTEFKNAKELCTGKKVMVVGAGKSAMDILERAVDFTPYVTSLMREPHWNAPLGFKVLGLHSGITLYSRFTSLLKQPPYTESGWINWLLSPLAHLYWSYLGHKLAEGLPYSIRPEMPLVNELDFIVTRSADFTEKASKGKISFTRTAIDHFVSNGVVMTDGTMIEADLVVLATGFKRNYFDVGTEDGEQWRYRGIIKPGIKNFAVIGNLTTSNTMLITNLQSVWLAEMLRGKVVLPSNDVMNADIASRKNHMQKVMENNKKSTFVLRGDFYAQQLIKDMGLQVRRSPRLLEYWFVLDTAPSYRTILTHRV